MKPCAMCNRTGMVFAKKRGDPLSSDYVFRCTCHSAWKRDVGRWPDWNSQVGFDRISNEPKKQISTYKKDEIEMIKQTIDLRMLGNIEDSQWDAFLADLQQRADEPPEPDALNQFPF